MGLTLAAALRLTDRSSRAVAASRRRTCIAFVGAGGKTTAIFQLARQLEPPALITTTTHLGAWQLSLADQHVIVTDTAGLSSLNARGVTLVTGPIGADGKAGPVASDVAGWLHDISLESDFPFLIEADGGRQKPLKAPAKHEPAIPGFVDTVVCVAGLSGLGRPLTGDYVHRPGIFASLGGLKLGDEISAEALRRVLSHPDGGLKNVPPGARRVVLLNQADTAREQSQAGSLAASLTPAFDSAIVASLQGEIVYAVHEPVAGILLAAGESKRLGRSKALLDWRGQPFIRAIASTALSAGVKPLIVVTGAGHADLGAALAGLPVQLAHNDNWQSGQASSIRAGVSALPRRTGAAIFLLADQPQVTPEVIRALMDAHAASLSPIVAPLVRTDRRANPVLFDRDTFLDLLALEGDIGGRAIFSKHRVEYLPWHDERLLLDVDTEADYRRLLEEDAA